MRFITDCGLEVVLCYAFTLSTLYIDLKGANILENDRIGPVTLEKRTSSDEKNGK